METTICLFTTRIMNSLNITFLSFLSRRKKWEENYFWWNRRWYVTPIWRCIFHTEPSPTDVLIKAPMVSALVNAEVTQFSIFKILSSITWMKICNYFVQFHFMERKLVERSKGPSEQDYTMWLLETYSIRMKYDWRHDTHRTCILPCSFSNVKQFQSNMSVRWFLDYRICFT